MIKFATDQTKPLVRNMWQSVFGDSDQFADIYFSQKYKNENTLIYFDEDKPVASLQMWEYQFSFYDEIIPICYLAGLCTYQEHRGNSYMTQLLIKAHQVMKERKIPLSILIPSEESLFSFYEEYGYAHTFQKGDETIPIREIIEKHNSLEKSFDTFSSIYNKTNFTVLKNLNQFRTIVEEQELTNFEPKANIDGMARIIDIDELMKIYAKKNPERKYTFRMTGDNHIPENNAFYTVEDGVVSKFPRAIADFGVNLIELCSLLMGLDDEELDIKIASKFSRHKPIMNLMLE